MGSSEPAVLMIAGAGRSGSTLLERILATAPGAVTVGELTEVWQRGLIEDERCGCGTRFSRCRFWGAIGERAFGGWERLDPERMIALERRLSAGGLPLTGLARLAPSRRRALREYGSALERIYRAVTGTTGAALIIDASKWPRHLYVLRRLTIRLQVVQIVRDPRGVAFSWAQETSKPHLAGSLAGGGGMRTYRPGGSAARWLEFNLLVDLAARLGTPTSRIGYERLMDDPGPALHGLPAAAVLGAAESSALDRARPAVELELSHGIAGNPVRFTAGRIELRTDRRWRSEMPAAQRLLVGAICGPLYAAYCRDPGVGGS
jgi:hypothetical protein